MQTQDKKFLRKLLLKVIRVEQNERDAAIRVLYEEYGVPQKRLAQSAGLTIASISRILSGKQRKRR